MIGFIKRNCIEVYLHQHEPLKPQTGIIRRFGNIGDIRIVTLYYNSRGSTRIEETVERKTIPAECRIYLSFDDTQEFKSKRRLIAIIEKQILHIKYRSNSKETSPNGDPDD